MKKICSIGIFCVLAWCSISQIFASALSNEDLILQRELYGRVEHALKNHDQQNYQRLLPKLESYPLYPYLVYEEFKQKIQTTKPMMVSLDKIRDFEKKFPDFPFLNTLNNIWLSQMAKNKNWEQFVKGYTGTDNVTLQCQYHFAKYQLTQDPIHLEAAKPLYLVGSNQPVECDALFHAWKKQGGLTQKLIWERTKLALHQKNFALASSLSKQLTVEKKNWITQWEKVIKNPYIVLTKKTPDEFTMPVSLKAEIFTQALRDLAKKEPEKIHAWWEKEQKDEHPSIPFSKTQSMLIRRDIGIYLSHQKSPLAENWLANLPPHVLDPVTQEWRIRLALINYDWQAVLMWINQLPPELKEDKSWRYWQARAFEKLGQDSEARNIYQELAKSRSYYGFLSSIRLNIVLSMQLDEVKVSPQELLNVATIPAMLRFEELIALNKMPLARVEWFRALNKMNPQQILVAAKIAQQKKLHDIAIFTVGKTDFRDDLPLRFPLAYRAAIVKNANIHNLDPAWIYAVARQESAFFTQAISSAGARGLMQLMPATAKIMAKQYDIPFHADESLHLPHTNIQLGTVYLKNLKASVNNHIVLATASYNAGPTRVRKWLPKNTLDADIWIESIPYRETREYVKNVLTFTSIYRQRLGYPTALALMMKPIPSKANT